MPLDVTFFGFFFSTGKKARAQRKYLVYLCDRFVPKKGQTTTTYYSILFRYIACTRTSNIPTSLCSSRQGRGWLGLGFWGFEVCKTLTLPIFESLFWLGLALNLKLLYLFICVFVAVFCAPCCAAYFSFIFRARFRGRERQRERESIDGVAAAAGRGRRERSAETSEERGRKGPRCGHCLGASKRVRCRDGKEGGEED